jgi:hypothetical protein
MDSKLYEFHDPMPLWANFDGLIQRFPKLAASRRNSIGGASRRLPPTLKTNAGRLSINRIPTAAVLRSSQVERNSALDLLKSEFDRAGGRETRHEAKQKLPYEPNLKLQHM